MSSKRLPICINPPIKGFQYFGFQLSVICTTGNYQNWLSNHFIQLTCDSSDNKHTLVYFYEPFLWYRTNPWFDSEWLSREENNLLDSNLIELIISYINKGSYVLAIVNEYHIPNRSAYKSFNQTHDILIFGFDLKAKLFDVLGYNEKGEYVHTYVTFGEFYKAFFNIENNFIVPFRLKQEFNYQFSLDDFKMILSDYVYSRNLTANVKRFKDEEYVLPNNIFGLDTYLQLRSYFETLREKKAVFNDVRSLHFILEHKQCMLSRIKYLWENRYLGNSEILFKEYLKLKNQALFAKSLQLKYSKTEDPRYIDRILKILEKMHKAESLVSESLLNSLKH